MGRSCLAVRMFHVLKLLNVFDEIWYFISAMEVFKGMFWFVLIKYKSCFT